ncbi:MAG: hypothetical protein AAGJ38_05065 [Planctomycetota bacterium]
MSASIAPIASKITLDPAEYLDGMSAADRATVRHENRVKEQIKTFGLSRREVQLHKLAQRGASTETLAAAEAVNKHLDAVEAEAKAKRRAAQITEQATSKTTRYQREIDELNDHLRAGRITQQTYNRAVMTTADRYGVSRRRAARLLPIQQRLNRAIQTGGTAMLFAGRHAGRYARGLAGVGVAAIAGAGFGLVAVARRQSEAIDQNAKFADELGLTTEVLAGYRHSAELTGTAQGTLDRGLQRLVRRLGEAKQGYGEGVKGLDLLGLSADQLNDKSPDEALGLIADRLNELPDPATKAAAAYALLGRQGQDMLNFLALGSEGFAANAEEADKLGKAYNRVDAAKVEAANDALTRSKAALEGVGAEFTIGIAPVIEAGAEKLVEWATAGEGSSSRVNAALAATGGFIGKVADWLELPKVAFYGAQIAITGGIALIAEGVQGVIDGAVYLLNLLPGVELEASRIAEVFADNAWDAVAESGRKADEAWSNFVNGSNSQAVADFLAETEAKAQTQAEAVAAAAAAAPAQIDVEGVANVEEELNKLDAAIEEFGRDPIEIKIEGLREAGATVEQLDRAREAMEKLARLERDAERRNSIADTLDDLESRVRTFGLTEEQRTLLDLEAAGATEEQLARAREAFEQLAGLEADRDETSRDRTGTDEVLRAGSAEAQLAAFRGQSGLSDNDDVKRQTEYQERIADGIDELNDNATSTSIFGEPVTIQVADL